jgi:hypothetical protein
MKFPLATAILLGIFSTVLHADFGYENKTEVTGGALLQTELAQRDRAKTPAALRLIKGQRMATITKEHGTVVNLGDETILEIDFSKKTYLSMKFAQMKETLDQAMKQGTPNSSFKTSSRSGTSKNIGILIAREKIVTMSRPGDGPESLARIFLDYWTMTPPGFAEMQDFRMRLAAKLGYAYAAGLAEIGLMKPELLAGLEESAKIVIESDEMPVEAVIRLGIPGAGDLAPAADTGSQKTGLVNETLTKLGHIAHRRSSQPPIDDDPALLAEVTVELGNFSAGPAEEAKFNVPAGFKEVKPAAAPKNSK